MQISILLFFQILKMFFMCLMGFLVVKSGHLRSRDSGPLSAATLYIVCPCAIINRSSACEASSPASLKVICCIGVVSSTNRDSKAQSYSLGCRMEPYSLASINSSNRAFI